MCESNWGRESSIRSTVFVYIVCVTSKVGLESCIAAKNHSTSGPVAPGARCPECALPRGAATGELDGQVALHQASSGTAA